MQPYIFGRLQIIRCLLSFLAFGQYCVLLKGLATESLFISVTLLLPPITSDFTDHTQFSITRQLNL